MEYFVSIKAVGDWELDVLAIPFGSRDSDGQWFDDRTEIMEGQFTTPLVLYQHGIKQGGKEMADSPELIGETVPGSLNKQVDGWHIKVKLNQALDAAKRIMQAVQEKMIAVSSDSISHLARLDIGGKLIQYEKNRPGRIAVWPFAGVSLWEKGNGNFLPANQNAVAMPAMKAMYRDAGLLFPDIDTSGDAEAEEVKRRARIAKQQAQKLIKALRV